MNIPQNSHIILNTQMINENIHRHIMIIIIEKGDVTYFDFQA